MHKPVAQMRKRLRNTTVFGSEDINGILRMLKSRQALGGLTYFYSNRNGVFEVIQRILFQTHFDMGLTTHSLLAGEAFALCHV
jgi:hypothetical protein